MDFFEPLSRATPAVLLLWLLLLGLLLCATTIGCCRAITFLFRQRRDQRQRLGSLRIHRMLSSLGIRTGRYLNHTDAPRVELHLARCRHCPDPASCDAYLAGDKASSPADFCPNFDELVELSRQRPAAPAGQDLAGAQSGNQTAPDK